MLSVGKDHRDEALIEGMQDATECSIEVHLELR